MPCGRGRRICCVVVCGVVLSVAGSAAGTPTVDASSEPELDGSDAIGLEAPAVPEPEAVTEPGEDIEVERSPERALYPLEDAHYYLEIRAAIGLPTDRDSLIAAMSDSNQRGPESDVGFPMTDEELMAFERWNTLAADVLTQLAEQGLADGVSVATTDDVLRPALVVTAPMANAALVTETLERLAAEHSFNFSVSRVPFEADVMEGLVADLKAQRTAYLEPEGPVPDSNFFRRAEMQGVRVAALSDLPEDEFVYLDVATESDRDRLNGLLDALIDGSLDSAYKEAATELIKVRVTGPIVSGAARNNSPGSVKAGTTINGCTANVVVTSSLPSLTGIYLLTAGYCGWGAYSHGGRTVGSTITTVVNNSLGRDYALIAYDLGGFASPYAFSVTGGGSQSFVHVSSVSFGTPAVV